MSSIKKIFSSIKKENKGIMILNINTILNSLFGFLLALTFDDIKNTLVDNVILNIIHSNIDKEKRYVTFLNSKIDLILILDMFIRLLIIIFIVYLFLKLNIAALG
mgnify:CR=1 FL=1|jgi:hypothetical protein